MDVLTSLEAYKFCPCCGSKEFNPLNSNAKKCSSCNYEYYLNAPSAVAVIAFDNNNRLLAVRRAKDPAKGTLDLPGGFVDVHETAEEALKREIMEETNLEIEIENYLFSIPNTYVYKGIDSLTLDLYFKARIKDAGRLRLNDGENTEALFLEIKDINPNDFGLYSNKVALNKLFFEGK